MRGTATDGGDQVPLPVIPSPAGHRWREWRVRHLPWVVFLLGGLGAGWLWQYQGIGRSLVGVAEGIRTTVSSPQSGTLVSLLVEPFAHVVRGQPLAVVEPFDPRLGLDLWRAEFDLSRLRATPSLNQRQALDLERLRMDLAGTGSELATARVRREFAERDVARIAALHREGFASDQEYDVVRNRLDEIDAEVKIKAQAVEELQTRLVELEDAKEDQADSVAAGLDPLEAARRLLPTNGAPLTLVSPIDGQVGALVRRPGEHVLEGDPLLTVQSLRADRVVGYLRQPFGFEPRPGQKVTVRRRDSTRGRFESRIDQVGSQFEPITNTLAVVRDGVLMDAGLPIVVEIPPTIELRPGEIVDLWVNQTPYTGEDLPDAPGRP